MIRNGGRYASLILGAGALVWLTQQGIAPIKLRDVNEHLGQENEYWYLAKTWCSASSGFS